MPSKTDAAAAAKNTADAAQVMLTINEFCMRLSVGDRRPELVSAFAASERASGNLRGTAEQFQARYQEFINKPV